MGAAVGAVYLPHPRFALVTWLVPPRALLLVVLVALGGRAVWLTVVAAAYLVQYASDLHVSPPVAQRWSYGVAGLVVLGSWLWERRRRRRATRGNPQNSRAGPRTCGPASDDALVG
jgi:membrane protein implicated in regulation of membrane protease activity